MADVIGYQCCVCGGDPRTEGLRHERPKNVTIIILCDLVDDVWTFVTFLRGTTYKTSADIRTPPNTPIDRDRQAYSQTTGTYRRNPLLKINAHTYAASRARGPRDEPPPSLVGNVEKNRSFFAHSA
jgi:hypothetical protein